MLDDDLFISDAPIEREVEIGGKARMLHFREIPAVEFMRFSRLTQQEGNDDLRDGAAAKLVAASLCNPDGSPAMTYEKALTLKSGPLNALFAVVLEINGARPGNV